MPEIRCYDYVNHPYDKVRAALAGDAAQVFRAATQAASTRADSIAAALRVTVAGLEVGADVVIEVGAWEETPRTGKLPAGSRLHLKWKAAHAPGMFPSMRAQLAIYPLTANETQLDFRGEYDPPMGLLGDAVDALVGHRVAEASVHRLVADVAGHLRRTIPD